MIKPTLAAPLAVCLLAMACTQAIAAPNPYSNFIVFGDSLSDAGQFTDTGGPAGSLPLRLLLPARQTALLRDTAADKVQDAAGKSFEG